MSNSFDIDKNLLYSRQIAELGEKTMGQLSNLHILVIGCKSVGFECSKCLALMGIGNIYLYDYNEVKITVSNEEIKTTNKELFGLNFGLNVIVKSINESRKYNISELTAKYLRTLNPFIQIQSNSLNQSLNNYLTEIENKLNLIIITDFNKIKLADFYSKYINKKLKVILGFTLGYYGIVHTNFPNHNVIDIDGEPKRACYLSNVKYENKIMLGQLEKNNLFSRNELLKITLENGIYYGKVLECKLDNISIEVDLDTDTKIGKFGLFVGECNSVYLEEEKQSYKPIFQDWNEIKNNIMLWNILSIGPNKYPLNKVLEFINSSQSPSKKKEMKYDDCTLFYEFYPLGSIIGGIIAHEAIKITGKYTPIEQSLLIDASVLLPKVGNKEKSGMYSNFENLISNEVISKFKNSRIFMIGAGALGCEHAKNLVMLNGFSNRNGQLTITDPDTISLSNLNRQFLFQSENIGHLKSQVIESKLSEYFPKIKIKSYKEAVSKESYKTTFKYDHWRTHDILLGALDNHDARLFIDKMAVKFNKPLFESGTQGTKCHTQTIIPFKTITYGEIEDPPQESIPMCTIKNFPNNYTHCIEWALEVFHCIFNQTVHDLIEIRNNKLEWLNQLETQNNNIKYERISKVNIFLDNIKKPINELISGIISSIYNEFYIEPIGILLNSFPEDLEENGSRFWGGKRKRPKIIDINDSIEFITGIYNGIIGVLGIENNEYELSFEEVNLKNCETKYTLDELEKNKSKEINSEIIDKLITKIKNQDYSVLSKMDIKSLEFDKDNDFTLEILDCLAKQRALSYEINLGNINETRKIAGRIIPALSTTTTIVSGFVMLELFKYLYDETPIDYNINLAINHYIGFETPEAPLKYTGMYNKAYNSRVIVIPDNITIWKKIKVSIVDDGVITINDLIEHIKSELDIENIDMIMVDKEIVYMYGMTEPLLLSTLWTKYNIEYNDSVELQLFINGEFPVITAPIYLNH